MEILTNKTGLPETLVRAVARDEHITKGSISVTVLIDSPQVRLLRKNNTYEVDVADKLTALLGTAIHHIIEHSDRDYQAKKSMIATAEILIKKARELSTTEYAGQAAGMDQVANYLFQIINWLFPETHQRYMYENVMSLDIGEGHILSGTCDLYDKQTETLYDYKSCTVFQYIYPEARAKWEEQANIYALMLETLHGVKVKNIRVVALFKDYSKYEKMKNQGYPPRQNMEITITRHSNESIWKLIQSHRDRHLVAEREGIMECTGKERWAIADEYAIMKPGAKRAIAKFPTIQMANKSLQDNLHMSTYKGAYVDTRPGVSKRCENYCDVSSVCSQYTKIKELKQQNQKIEKDVEDDEFSR